MNRKVCVRLGILALLAIGEVQVADCQSLSCSDGKSRAPSVVDSIKITIADFQLTGDNTLSSDDRKKLLNRIKQLDLKIAVEENDSDWIAQIDSQVRDDLQEQGYFRVFTETTPYLIRAEDHSRNYVVRIAIDSGPQYQIGEIRFSGSTVFSKEELRVQFSLHQGDLFNVSEFWRGLAAMTKLYSRKGFIDMVAEPDMRMVESGERALPLVNILLKVDEGRQYHAGNIELHGLNQQTERDLRSKFESGQIVDAISLSDFLESHVAGPRLHSGDSPFILRRDYENATLDLFLDVQPCPKT